MSDIWNHNEGAAIDHDLIGFDVEASDGHIGKIDATSMEAGLAHIVVDTHHWLFGKKRLIPAGVISEVDRHERKVVVKMTKEQIKHAPDFDPGWLNDATYKDRMSNFYGPHVI